MVGYDFATQSLLLYFLWSKDFDKNLVLTNVESSVFKSLNNKINNAYNSIEISTYFCIQIRFTCFPFFA